MKQKKKVKKVNYKCDQFFFLLLPKYEYSIEKRSKFIIFHATTGYKIDL